MIIRLIHLSIKIITANVISWAHLSKTSLFCVDIHSFTFINFFTFRTCSPFIADCEYLYACLFVAHNDDSKYMRYIFLVNDRTKCYPRQCPPPSSSRSKMPNPIQLSHTRQGICPKAVHHSPTALLTILHRRLPTMHVQRMAT
jgi:hypothetical protein